MLVWMKPKKGDQDHTKQCMLLRVLRFGHISMHTSLRDGREWTVDRVIDHGDILQSEQWWIVTRYECEAASRSQPKAKIIRCFHYCSFGNRDRWWCLLSILQQDILLENPSLKSRPAGRILENCSKFECHHSSRFVPSPAYLLVACAWFDNVSESVTRSLIHIIGSPIIMF